MTVGSCALLLCPLVGQKNESAPTEEQRIAPSPVLKARKLLDEKKDEDALRLLSEFLSASHSHPDSAEIRFLLGVIHTRADRFSEAMNILSSLRSLHQGSEWTAQGIEEIIKLHLRRKNTTGASREKDALLREYPESPVTRRVWTAEGDSLYNARKFAEALEIYESLGRNISEPALARKKIAAAIVHADSNPAALLEAARAAQRDQTWNLTMSLYQNLAAMRLTPEQTYEVKTQLGVCHYQRSEREQKDVETAERLWQEVARADPKGSWGGESRWYLVRMCSLEKADPLKAAEMCEAIARDFPKGAFRHEQALFTRAWLYLSSKKWEKAKLAFDEFVAAYPDKEQHPPIIEYRKRVEDQLSALNREGGR